jgi:hypothetical protein
VSFVHLSILSEEKARQNKKNKRSLSIQGFLIVFQAYKEVWRVIGYNFSFSIT